MNTSFWLKLSAFKNVYGRWQFRGAPKTSVGKPSVGRDEVAVKVNVDVPDAYFDDPQFTVNISVPPKERSATVNIDAGALQKVIEDQIGFRVTVDIPAEDSFHDPR